jgi:hypothetical protein
MKYKELKVGDKTYDTQNKIEEVLKKHGFFWVIDAEFEEADIEIKNETLIWNSGTWLHGTWEYGIWMDGIFHGQWLNGIFENGQFQGEWESGIDFTENGVKINNSKDEEN